MKNIKAFTLVEILITITIIGVVAAITLPALLTNINDKILENQSSVFNAKLIKGLNILNIDGGINDNYSTTEDFVKALSAHIKIIRICGNDKIDSCFPYKEIEIRKNNTGSKETVNISNLKTGSNLYLADEGFEDTASFILADGTPVLISYKKNCISDSDKAYRTIHPCIAGIYDANINKRPNAFSIKIDKKGTKLNSDIRSINGGHPTKCISTIGNVCITMGAFYPDDIKDTTGTLPYSGYGIDYWEIAQRYCNKNYGHLAELSELTEIANILYDAEFDSDASHTTWQNFYNGKLVTM